MTPDDEGLGPAGVRLWRKASADCQSDPLRSVLLLEACRIVDRLERLDRQLRGEDWLRFRAKTEDGAEVIVYVDRVLAEAREQATALKGIVAELRQAGAKVKAEVPKRTGGIADLTARLAERRNQAKG